MAGVFNQVSSWLGQAAGIKPEDAEGEKNEKQAPAPAGAAQTAEPAVKPPDSLPQPVPGETCVANPTEQIVDSPGGSSGATSEGGRTPSPVPEEEPQNQGYTVKAKEKISQVQHNVSAGVSAAGAQVGEKVSAAGEKVSGTAKEWGCMYLFLHNKHDKRQAMISDHMIPRTFPFPIYILTLCSC